MNKVKHFIDGEPLVQAAITPTYLIKEVDGKEIVYLPDCVAEGDYRDFTISSQIRTGLELGYIQVPSNSGLTKELYAEQLLQSGLDAIEASKVVPVNETIVEPTNLTE